MADKQSTKPPGGTRDFLPDDVRRREYVIDVVRDVYERYGFEPLETPAFENIETLLGKYGDEGNKLIFENDGSAGLLSTAGGLLFSGDGQNLVAYEAKTGKPLWHSRIGATGNAPRVGGDA